MRRHAFLWQPAEGKNGLLTEARKLLAEKDPEKAIRIVDSPNIGFYSATPLLRVLPEDAVYAVKDASQIVAAITGDPTAKPLLVPRHPAAGAYKQKRIVLRNMGYIDPENIEDYIRRDGYKGLSRVFTSKMSPEDVIAEMKTSGLRGRGGAGFPTWLKWDLARKNRTETKFVICNADEGDPGAYMDRSTLEGDPHAIIEGMALAAYAISASHGFIYIRAEYPLAIRRLEIAIEQAYHSGLLGKNILGTGFSFELHLRWGAGAFVCGEETALIASLEGNRGMPKPRPPYPSDKGLWDAPSVINNVETYANIPVIFARGADWFASIGTAKSTGTKVFALTGKVVNSGLIEVPMGITLREIIFDIGGGIRDGKKFKAVQTGGPSGGVIPEEFLDTPVDYEHLQQLGSIMGSGGMIVMDEDDCMIDVSKFYLQFSVDESCGKCAPCRIGGNQMYMILDNISKGKSEEADIGRLKRIGYAMQKASLCGLGQTTPNPVLSSLKYFGDEYADHITKKKCRTSKCRDLVVYTISQEKCIGCSLCALRCPVKCISGEKKKPYSIRQEQCTKCGECYRVCKFDAVIRD